MRHGAKVNHLSRTASHRRALLSNLACELIRHKRISTTLAKAKSLRVYVEPLLTKSKSNTTHQRRIVFSYLQDNEAVTELFATVSGKIASRPGGYTRIIKLGKRMGDAAEMALIELVDFNETYTKSAGAAKEGAAKRTRRGGKKKAEETVGTTPAPVAETAPAETATAEKTTSEAPATVEPEAKEKTGE